MVIIYHDLTHTILTLFIKCRTCRTLITGLSRDDKMTRANMSEKYPSDQNFFSHQSRKQITGLLTSPRLKVISALRTVRALVAHVYGLLRKNQLIAHVVVILVSVLSFKKIFKRGFDHTSYYFLDLGLIVFRFRFCQKSFHKIVVAES